uniref:Integrase, catalytic region, zinc finger, CCHC-type, peptidase aspartic, catalytic n=1 Tax=Tanacetum cinerariifolium TaxID=118510 RepID=A0A699HZU5_TANCI|nr:hypothetical protein [Tanacetum cinerariifolium]
MVNTRSTNGGLLSNPQPLETQVANLTASINQITQTLQDIKARLNNGEGISQRRKTGGQTSPNEGHNGRLTKVEFFKYDGEEVLSWLYGAEHERMILESVENGPLIWPTVEENRVTRTKKYAELSDAEKTQADCDMKATNIILQDLHTTNFDQLHAYVEQHELHANEVRLLRERNQDPLAFVANRQMKPPHFNTYQSSYNNPQLQQQFLPYHSTIQMNHQTLYVSQIAYQSPQVSTQPMTESPLVDSGFAVLVFSSKDDPITCLNKEMAFLIAVASSRVTVQQVQGRQGKRHMARQCTQPKRPRNATWYKDKAMLAEAREAGQILDEEQLAFLADLRVPDGQAVQTIIPNNAAFQTKYLNTYDSDCDDISNVKAVLIANISNYGSDVISEVPHFETYLNDMENQSMHAMQDYKQTPVVDVTNNEITKKANKEQDNESVTAELERYKEWVKTFEQRLNIDLSSRERIFDSQMDDMIKEKLALKEQVDSLEQNLSK